MTPGIVTTEVRGIVCGPGVHLDLAVPVITIGLRGSTEQRVIGGWREAAAGRTFLHTMAGHTDVMRTDTGDTAMIDRRGGRVVRRTQRWISVACAAIEGEVHRFGVAFETAHTDATCSVQVHAMTERAGILNITGSIMEGGIWSCPVLRMGIISLVATFAAISSSAADTDVEAWIAARSTELAMTALAGRQIRLGIGAVIAAEKVGPVNRMRCLTRSVWMTALAVETRREAARCRRTALELLTMTAGTGLKAVYCGIAAMIDIWV